MSGIVGSRINIRGSGLVGSLGTDGQVLTSSGAGTGAIFESAGLTSGNINNIFRFSVTDGGLYENATGTDKVSFDAISWSATDTRIYVIHSLVSTRPAKTTANTDYVIQYMKAWYGTTDRSQGDTTTDTRLASNDWEGRRLDAASTTAAYGYHSYPVLGSFTAGSTATHYFYLTQHYANGGVNSRCYSAADIAPWTTVIYEILP